MLIPFDNLNSIANVSELVYEPCLGHGAFNGLRVRVSSFVTKTYKYRASLA